MKFQLNRKLQLSYGSALFILIVFGILSYTTLQNLLASSKQVAHSDQVIAKLEQTLSVMKDAETGQRGFLLSGDKRYLEPYNGAYQRALLLIDTVKMLTKDNIDQQINMSALKAIMIERLNILQSLIDKKNEGKTITLIDLECGKAAMDALRAKISKAENDEHNLLTRRTDTLNKYTRLAPLFILSAVILAATIALISYYNVIGDFDKKIQLQNELLKKEQETAAFNEELSAANEEVTSVNEELTTINAELAEARDELINLNRFLEEKVDQRTHALQESEEETQALNEELTSTNEELMSTNEELSRNREELQKSEALFKSIALNIPQSLILVLTNDERYITVEGELKNRLGYNENSYFGKRLSDTMAPVDYTALVPLYDRALAGHQVSTERRFKGADLKIDFVPLREDGIVYAVMIIALNISDIKRAEERSAKLAAIVESSDDAIIGKTLDGIITSWNHGAERLFGYVESEMIGESVLKLLPQDRWDEEPQIIGKIRSGERVEHFETLRLNKDGKLIDVSLTISPVKNKEGMVIGVSKIARDISEQKRDEQRKNDFIGMVSHELKTPLTSLTALIQVANLKLKKSDDPFLVGVMDKANAQARKMATMINGFLNISRLESSQILIEPEKFNLRKLIESIVQETEITATSHQISLMAFKPVFVNADSDKVGSVITNLLSNAIKYSLKGTDILINCELTATLAQISVRDQGTGIQPADQEKLFDRFYRVQGDHTRNISGFGIGLYLCAEIIHRHGGEIWVESEWGKGSTFSFTLPLA